MNAITKHPASDVFHLTLFGFGIDELGRDEWLQSMHHGLREFGVPDTTRKTLDAAFGHFAETIRAK